MNAPMHRLIAAVLLVIADLAPEAARAYTAAGDRTLLGPCSGLRSRPAMRSGPP